MKLRRKTSKGQIDNGQLSARIWINVRKHKERMTTQ